MAKKRKVKVPKSVKELRVSPKKFAKKNGIKLKGGSKKDRKYARKRLRNEYSEVAVTGLNKAVKILAENPGDGKKIGKIKDGVENIIRNPEVMARIAKLYNKHPEAYPNMLYLPSIIMNTLAYYASDNISDEEKEFAKTLDVAGLTRFCEKILRRQIKRYRKLGMSETAAFQLAVVIPTTKLFQNRFHYRRLISQLYDIAANEELDVDTTLAAICRIDKKKRISRKDFLEGFFTEFILTKNTNKTHSFNDSQKELHETLIDRALVYLDNQKPKKLHDILKTYIKRRKTAESLKTDTKRVIKFIDHAHSNSSYTNIKAAVQELIADNASNELYLS
ncbi:MAG: hypothetical protein NC131_11145 [Roseburia sp.]|nr:hypothetical protein [Roseburia sp.]